MLIDEMLVKLEIETHAERLREGEKARPFLSSRKTSRLPLVLQSLLSLFA